MVYRQRKFAETNLKDFCESVSLAWEGAQAAAGSPISTSGILLWEGSRGLLDNKAYCKCSLRSLHVVSWPVQTVKDLEASRLSFWPVANGYRRPP